jgi:predicted NBD/HSP70 family sugar kinase
MSCMYEFSVSVGNSFMTNDVTIGVDLGGTELLMVSGKKQVQIQTGEFFSVADVEQKIRDFIQNLNDIPNGVGIAIPGLLDSTGCVQACDVLPRIVGWNPIETLADIGCLIEVTNDVNAALAEEFHDAEPGLNAGIIMVGTAVGSSFLVNGLPLLGARGWAGELGYMPISMNGQVKRLDELAGGSFIAKQVGLDAQSLALKAQENDVLVLAAIREGGFALGLGLAAVINLFNPSKIVLGGGTLKLPGYEEAAYVAAKQYSLPELWRSCALTQVRAGDAVVALGAARIIFLSSETNAGEHRQV